MRVNIDKKSSERGQSFVELAISLVFLLILFAAMVDLGWAFYTVIALRDAAQEAAVYGSMCPNDKSLIVDRLQQSASAPIDMEDIYYDYLNPNNPANHIAVCIIDPVNPPAICDHTTVDEPIAFGNSVRVEAWVDHEIRTPFVGAFIRATHYPLRVNVSDTILRVDDDRGCDGP